MDDLVIFLTLFNSAGIIVLIFLFTTGQPEYRRRKKKKCDEDHDSEIRQDIFDTLTKIKIDLENTV